MNLWKDSKMPTNPVPLEVQMIFRFFLTFIRKNREVKQ